MYDKIYKGTFLGGNLTTAIKNKTKNENGGAVIWGGIRDTEQMKKIEDTQVYYRGIDPTPIQKRTFSFYLDTYNMVGFVCSVAFVIHPFKPDYILNFKIWSHFSSRP